MYFPVEPLIKQHGQAPAMINMGMAEHHRIEFSGVKREWIVVSKLIFSTTLNQSTVEQYATIACFYKVA